MVKRYYYIAILTISLTRGNGEQRAPDVKQSNKGCTVNNSRQIAIT